MSFLILRISIIHSYFRSYVCSPSSVSEIFGMLWLRYSRNGVTKINGDIRVVGYGTDRVLSVILLCIPTYLVSFINYI